jgi:hypothetical protein
MTEDPQSQHADERIDTNFRNGSVTAVGIILGFSLGFLSQWAANPIAWSKIDIVAAIPIVVGIILQGKAFADLLSTESLSRATITVRGRGSLSV